jgi:hypothetical protein
MRPEPYALAVATVATLGAFAATVVADPARVRIRAATRIAEPGTLAGEGFQEVRGRVVDDLGQPIGAAEIALALSEGPEPTGVRACDGFAPPSRSGPEWRLQTDGEGAFCMRVDSVPSGARGSLRFQGTPFFAPFDANFPLQAQRQAVRLVFDAPVIEAVLDRPSFVTWVSAEPVKGAGYGTTLRVTITHVPREGAPAELATLDLQVGARTRLEVPSKTLGAPGMGELVAEQRGTWAVSPSKASVVFRRVAAVTLSVAGEIGPVARGDAAELAVGAGSVMGAAPSGWVEATIDGRAAGVGPVEHGVAHVTLRIEDGGRPTYDVQLRYISGDPWWLPGEPLRVQIPVTSPSPLRALPWLVAVVAIAYWVVRTWRRPGRSLRSEVKAVPKGRADLELVEAGPPGTGWHGTVFDAHDGLPVAGANLQVLVPTFDGEGLASAGTTTVEGHFVLPPFKGATSANARLRVVAMYHSTLVRKLPQPGRVIISVTSRRRAMLERLVSWARAMGRPWMRDPEPTPADIARTAALQGNPSVERWARSLEEAAYGPSQPDEPREREILGDEPALLPRSDDR